MEWNNIIPTELEMEKYQYVLDNGRYFGYPSCCIYYFIMSQIRWERIVEKLKKDNKNIKEIVKSHRKYLFSERKNKPWEHIHRSSGFMPCPECSQKLYNSGDCISSLIRNRECSISFNDDK